MDIDFPPYDEQAAADPELRARHDAIDTFAWRGSAVAELRDAAETVKRLAERAEL